MLSSIYFSSSLFAQQQTSTSDTWLKQGMNVLKKDTAGNVGIGTTQPTEKLDVKGNVRIDGLKGAGDRIVIVDKEGKLRAVRDGEVIHGHKPLLLNCAPPVTDAWITASNNNIRLCADYGKVGIGTNPEKALHIRTVHDESELPAISNHSHYGIRLEDFYRSQTFYTTNPIWDIEPIGSEGNKLCIGNYNRALNIKKRFMEFSMANGGQLTFSPNIKVEISNDLYLTGDLFLNGKIRTTNSNGFVNICGNVRAQEFEIDNTSWCDFVFYENYRLMKLEDVEKFKNENKHLPGIPSEEEIMKNGLKVSDMLKLQMQKIEELFLYTIELKKEIEMLKKEKEEIRKGK